MGIPKRGKGRRPRRSLLKKSSVKKRSSLRVLRKSRKYYQKSYRAKTHSSWAFILLAVLLLGGIYALSETGIIEPLQTQVGQAFLPAPPPPVPVHGLEDFPRLFLEEDNIGIRFSLPIIFGTITELQSSDFISMLTGRICAEVSSAGGLCMPTGIQPPFTAPPDTITVATLSDASGANGTAIVPVPRSASQFGKSALRNQGEGIVAFGILGNDGKTDNAVITSLAQQFPEVAATLAPGESRLALKMSPASRAVSPSYFMFFIGTDNASLSRALHLAFNPSLFGVVNMTSVRIIPFNAFSLSSTVFRIVPEQFSVPVCGDVDASLTVDTRDISFIDDYLASRTVITLEQAVRANTNGDDILDAADKGVITDVMLGAVNHTSLSCRRPLGNQLNICGDLLCTGIEDSRSCQVDCGPGRLICGDVNNNGRVGIEDALRLSQYLAQIIALDLDTAWRSNVDGDSLLSSHDSEIIANVSVGILSNSSLHCTLPSGNQSNICGDLRCDALENRTFCPGDCGNLTVLSNITINITVNVTVNATVNGTINITSNLTGNVSPNASQNASQNLTENISLQGGLSNATANLTTNQSNGSSSSSATSSSSSSSSSSRSRRSSSRTVSLNRTASTSSASSRVCIESWVCSDWGPCVNGVQRRQCSDDRRCGTIRFKRPEQQQCIPPVLPVEPVVSPPPPELPVPAPRCDDGVWNQDEEGIDCGGLCSPCIPIESPEPISEPFNWLSFLILLIAVIAIGGVIGYLVYSHRRPEPVPPRSNTSQLKDYVRRAMHTGRKPDEIRRDLRAKHWKNELIENAIAEVMLETPVVAPPVFSPAHPLKNNSSVSGLRAGAERHEEESISKLRSMAEQKIKEESKRSRKV